MMDIYVFGWIFILHIIIVLLVQKMFCDSHDLFKMKLKLMSLETQVNVIMKQLRD